MRTGKTVPKPAPLLLVDVGDEQSCPFFPDNFEEIDKRVDHLSVQCVDRLMQQGFPRSVPLPLQGTIGNDDG